MSALRVIIMNDIISIVNSVLNSNSSSVVEDSFEKDDIYSFYEKYCQDKSVRESIYKWLNRDDLIKLVSDLDDSFYNTDLVSQFFSYFNMVNQDKDDFYNFFLLLKKNFGVNKNILEIGSGWFPSLGKYIDNYQMKIGSGRITCYDEALRVLKHNNVNLVKKSITKDTNIGNYDLVCAHYSCSATDLFVDLCIDNHKEFILSLCPCKRNYPTDFKEVMHSKSRKTALLLNEYFSSLSWEGQRDFMYALNGRPNEKYEKINNKLYAIYLYQKMLNQKEKDSFYDLLLDSQVKTPVLLRKIKK